MLLHAVGLCRTEVRGLVCSLLYVFLRFFLQFVFTFHNHWTSINMYHIHITQPPLFCISPFAGWRWKRDDTSNTRRIRIPKYLRELRLNALIGQRPTSPPVVCLVKKENAVCRAEGCVHNLWFVVDDTNKSVRLSGLSARP